MAEREKSDESEQVEQLEKGDESTTSSWSFGGWLSYAKEQSKKTYDMVRKDLVEFKTTVRADTVSAITRTVDTVKQKVTMSNLDDATEAAHTSAAKLIDDVSKLGIVAGDSETSECVTTDNDDLKTLDHLELRILELTRNADAFLTVPKSTAEFEAWNAAFSVDENTQQISDILIQYTTVRKFYNDFVPAKISHADFWRNLLFRIEQLRAEQATREQLKQRASKHVAATATGSDTWEEDEEDQLTTVPTISSSTASAEPDESHAKDNVIELEKHESLQLETDGQVINSDVNAVSSVPVPVHQAEPTPVDLDVKISDADVGTQKQPETVAASETTFQRNGETVKEKAASKASNESQESYDDWEKWDE